MKFLYYDIIFLILFSIGVAVFLYKRRKKVEREGILFLYKTKFGLKAINKIGKRFPGLLRFLSSFIVIGGYLTMFATVLLFILTLIAMINALALPKIPPLIPVVPYLPGAFVSEEILPPLFFTYWIICIAIIAISHEFAHGIFARMNNIKIKSTGFGFLGPLLAAFVELDEKKMAKKPIKAQLSVLGAGSMANFATGVLFFGILYLFFVSAYSAEGVNVPSLNFRGVEMPGYFMEAVNTSELIYNNEKVNLTGLYKEIGEKNISEVLLEAENKSYFATQALLSVQINEELEQVILYSDTPAHKVNLSGAIKKIIAENKSYGVKNLAGLHEALGKLSPGQEILIETTKQNYSLELAEHPLNKSKAFLGVSFFESPKNILGKIVSFFSIREKFIYYEPKVDGINGQFIKFVYNLLYWIVLISFGVMLINMLPFGIFDGGRFFFLTMLAITKSESKAMSIFKATSFALLALFLLIMLVWMIKAF